ncbi:MAG: recombinase family protein [Planctomycetota bacterium]
MSEIQTTTLSDAEQVTDQQDQELITQQKSGRTTKRRNKKKPTTRMTKASKRSKKAKAKKVAKKKTSKVQAKPKPAKAKPTLVVEEQTEEDLIQAFLDSKEGQLVVGDPALTPRQRKKQTKGLPEVENLRALAQTWLEQTHKLYPDLVKSGVVPVVTESNIAQLVQAFIKRFISGVPVLFDHQLDENHYEGIGAVYLRYSDDNSNPTSLDDQLRLAIKKAAQEKRFIPWEYVFADASITAQTALRRGYVLAKDALQRFKGTALETLYVDDYSRATRAAIETYRLARLMEMLGHRLIGVSDGFDLYSKNSQILMMATAMLNEMFLSGLREKVLRGMKGAAERGTSLGMLPFGYKLVVKRDEDGNPIRTAKDTELRMPAVDESLQHHVVQAAKWVADDHLSYKEVARRFKLANVGGSNRWSGSRISKLLANELYVGTRIYNRTRTVWDKETGEFSRKPNSMDQWVVKEMPELRIIDQGLWDRLRSRAEEIAAMSPRTGKKLDRQQRAMPECRVNDLYPSSIVDGVLYCGDCGRPMRLIRSGENDKQYACPSGNNEIHDCTFHSSKSLNQITAGLLPYIKNKVLTEERVSELVAAANVYLLEDAARPRVDLAPLRKAIAAAREEERRLVVLVGKHRDDHDMTSFLNRTDELRKQVTDLQKQLREGEAANAAPPPPIELDDALGYLEDLRGLMEQNVEGSAHAMRALLGITS